ncbi:hypothetical protein [Sphingomonas sp. HMP6]|uniref:hypothetical protein n=1 Tax=Sphingomonas sp. HMP6 TaxID=1517551 RepID=UPI001597130C|nr:hypothetical protein [Sphingomonas sp. HMP6]
MTMATAQMLQAIVLLMAWVYCVVQTIRDFRRRSYLMATVGVLFVVAIAVFVTIPIETHAVKIDLPMR